MSSPHFWANSSSEFVVSSTGGGKGSDKLGKGGGWTGGDWSNDGDETRLPATEEVVISPAHGSNVIDFTDIDGISINKFSSITIHTSDLSHASTGGASIDPKGNIQVSSDGGSTWKSAGTSYKVSGQSASFSFGGDLSQAVIDDDSTGIFKFNALLNDVNQTAPTRIQASEFSDATNPTRWNSVTEDAEAFDAIRILVTVESGASRVFDGGSVTLVGYRTKGTVQVIDCAATSATEYFVDIPAGHTIASVYAQDIDLSALDFLTAQASVAGTEVAGATDYLRFAFNAGSSSPSLGGWANFATWHDTGIYGHTSVWNLNVAAPLVFQDARVTATSSFPNETWFGMSMRAAAVSYSQLRIATRDGASYDSGKIYIVTYKAKASILAAEDFGTSPANTLDVTGITKGNASAVVFASYDLATSASDFMKARVLIDGVPDTGATDYQRSQMKSSGDSASFSSLWTITFTSNTDQTLCALFIDMPQVSPTQHVESVEMSVGSDRWSMSGSRLAHQVENGLRFYTSGANNLTAGTLYAVGYKL